MNEWTLSHRYAYLVYIYVFCHAYQWQISWAENVSYNVAPIIYHHSVVIQHLLSDTLYQTGDIRLLQMKPYILLDNENYRSVWRQIHYVIADEQIWEDLDKHFHSSS